MSARPVGGGETARRAIYLLFALACIANGLWLLIDPVNWNDTLRMLLDDFSEGGVHVPLLRRLGATYLCLSLAFLWCIGNLEARRRVHPVLLLYFGLQAAIQVGELVSAQVPSHRWVTDAPLVLLPPLVLLVMLVRLPSARPAPRGATGRDAPTRRVAQKPAEPRQVAPAPVAASGETETGTVKWFDRKKGFGFILRPGGEELFVHYRAIRGTGHRYLRDGQPVRYRLGQGNKGPQADDVEALD